VLYNALSVLTVEHTEESPGLVPDRPFLNRVPVLVVSNRRIGLAADDVDFTNLSMTRETFDVVGEVRLL
jgi:hypothetical protein